MVRRMVLVLVCLAALALPAGVAAQNRIDVVTPLAPELAAYGAYDVGVRTLRMTDRNRPDVLGAAEGKPLPRYDRTLTLDAWYPAGPATAHPDGEYHTITRDPGVTVILRGKAIRDAAPAKAGGPFPLVIVSHGYPGNRYLLSHLCENLASKGFVVVSIDHPDSTYDDQKNFGSTLYNRPFDQLFVLDEIARLAATAGSVFSGLVDAGRTGLVGYSMGGYGVVNVAGAGYSRASETFSFAPPNRMLADRGAAALVSKPTDPRIKAVIAIGPWGMQNGFWDADGLRGIRVPLLLVAGSADEISGYEKGTRAIYEGAVNADRYLLTFRDAGHNAAAPIPAPAETSAYSAALKSFPFVHYADPVWDTTRMNNILDHFATAWFGLLLKGEQNQRAYLDVPAGGDRPPPVAQGAAAGQGDAGWKGFKPRTTVGLTLEHGRPAPIP